MMADPFNQPAAPNAFDKLGGELVREPGTGKWFRITSKGGWTPVDAPKKISRTGLYAQGVNDAVASTIGLPVDAINLGLSAVGLGSNRPIGGSRSIAELLDDVATAPSRITDAVSFGSLAPFADGRTSRQTPRDSQDHVAYGMGRGLGNALSALLPAALIAQAGQAGPVTRAIAGEMTRGPGTQMAAGMAGGIVGELTQNPWLGLLTNVGAGVGANLGRRTISASLGRVDPPATGALPSPVPPGPAIGPQFLDALRSDAPMLLPPLNPTTIQRAAGNVILRSLERDGSSVAQAQDDLTRLGSEGMLADVAGRNLRGKVRMISNAPGEGANIAEQALLGRKTGEASRVENLLTSILGQRVQAGATVDDLLKERQTVSQPLYDRAFARPAASNDPVANKMADITRASQGMPPVTYGVTSPRVQEFLADPIMREGLRRGMEVQRLEALGTGRPFNPKDYGVTGFTQTGDPIIEGVPNMRLLDAGKRGLDEILEGYRDGTTGKLVLDQRGRAIDQVRKSLLDELDSLNSNYAAARAAWSGPSSAIAAIAQGRSALSSRMDPHQLAKQYGVLSDADKEMFRLGAADWLRRTAGENTRGSAAERLFGDPRAVVNNRADRLKIIFGDDFGRIRDLATNEAAFNKTLSVLSGSSTKPLADETAATLGMLRSGTSAARGQPTGVVEMLGRLGQQARRRVSVDTEEVRTQAARMLFAGTPEEKAKALRLLSEISRQQKTGSSPLEQLPVFAWPPRHRNIDEP